MISKKLINKNKNIKKNNTKKTILNRNKYRKKYTKIQKGGANAGVDVKNLPELVVKNPII